MARADICSSRCSARSNDAAADEQMTPHPTSYLGHPLPSGEGKPLRPGAPSRTCPLPGERVARRRVRGHFSIPAPRKHTAKLRINTTLLYTISLRLSRPNSNVTRLQNVLRPACARITANLVSVARTTARVVRGTSVETRRLLLCGRVIVGSKRHFHIAPWELNHGHQSHANRSSQAKPVAVGEFQDAGQVLRPG